MEAGNHSKSGAKPKSHTSRKTKYQFYMENIKKIMAIVGLITITLILISFATKSTENEEAEKFLTMRVIEVGDQLGGINREIIIVDENGKIETIKLVKVTKTAENTLIINNTLNNIAGKGYKLVFTTTGGNEMSLLSTYTFVKK